VINLEQTKWIKINKNYNSAATWQSVITAQPCLWKITSDGFIILINFKLMEELRHIPRDGIKRSSRTKSGG
jgi:hypothetical protein